MLLKCSCVTQENKAYSHLGEKYQVIKKSKKILMIQQILICMDERIYYSIF